GHYEVPLLDPRRDHTHGRIWRVVYRGDAGIAAPLGSASVSNAGSGVSPAGSTGQISRETRETVRETRALPGTMPDLMKLDLTGLVEKLGSPNLLVRVLATNELVERDDK